MICLTSSLSSARIKIFSSLTKNGRYLIVFPVDGNSNSYVGVAIFGKGIMTYRNSVIIIYYPLPIPKDVPAGNPNLFTEFWSK